MASLDLSMLSRCLLRTADADLSVVRRQGDRSLLEIRSRRQPGVVVLAEYEDSGDEPRLITADRWREQDSNALNLESYVPGWGERTLSMRLCGRRSDDAEHVAEFVARLLEG